VRLIKALQDGHLTKEERKAIEETKSSFGLAAEVHETVYREEALKVIHQAFDAAVADHKLTPSEEEQLAQIATNLDVKLNYDEDTRRLLDRYRLLGRLASGQIPPIRTDLMLPSGETPYAEFLCRLHERRLVTKSIAYRGPAGRIRIMKGLSWRFGSVSLSRITAEELRQLDAGTLYVTSKRLLFQGRLRNATIGYGRIIRFTLYKDGIAVEKDRGPAAYFLGHGDIELIGATLDAALARFHEA
jgi:hypothetical protein